jgi:hypothetical protein
MALELPGQVVPFECRWGRAGNAGGDPISVGIVPDQIIRVFLLQLFSLNSPAELGQQCNNTVCH